MIVLNQNELEILQRFTDGDVQKGWASVDLDMLASRGLLVRQERVGSLNAVNQKEPFAMMLGINSKREERAKSCHYRISKRGRRALAHPFVSSF